MKVYLMQHGNAMTKEENPERPLNEQGIQDVEKVSAVLKRRDPAPQFSEIRHSGKRRAQETAEIVARFLEQTEKVVAANGLNPNDNVLPIASTLRQEANDLLLVGHLPFLSRLASHLLTGKSDRELIQFQQGGVLCLSRQENEWKLCWMLIPDLL